MVAAPFEVVPSKVVVEASPVNVKLQGILTLQNPYLNWVLPLLIFAQQGQGVYTQLSRLDRLDKLQVLERCSCGGGTWSPGHKLRTVRTWTNLPSRTIQPTSLKSDNWLSKFYNLNLARKIGIYKIYGCQSFAVFKYLQAHWDIAQPQLGKVPPWNKRRLLGTPPWCRNSHIRHMNHLPPETLRGSSHNPILLLWFITWNLKCPRITGTSRPMDLKDPRSQWHMARSFAGPDLGDVEYSSPYPIILRMSS